MKNIVLSLIVLLLCSCSDLLEEKPQAIAVETFYNTAGEVEAGVAAIYSPLRGSVYKANYPALLEVSSDLFLAGRGSWAPPSEYQGLNGTNITRAQSVWDGLYLSVRNANLIIKNAPDAKNLTEKEINKYIGEAKFLRAFTYFQLVRNWGPIPLRTEENMEEYNLPRTPVDEVYKLIVSDLEFAESSLPGSIEVAGHPSKWSAKTLLADVYFHMNQYDKAAEKSDEVIKSGIYSLVEVTSPDDFEKLYGAPVVHTPEEIFYFKYVVEDHFEFALYFHGIGKKYIQVDGYYAIYCNASYTAYKNQDDNDLRKQYNWYPYDGFDPGTILCKKFNDTEGRVPGNDFPVYRFADCLLIYAEASCHTAGKPTAEGVEALNMVRRRAYGYPSAQPSPVDFKQSDYSKDSFIELCIKERGYETIGEAKRWLDIKRSGMAAKYVKENRGQEIAETHYLWPIPVSELNYNEAITNQNPGY